MSKLVSISAVIALFGLALLIVGCGSSDSGSANPAKRPVSNGSVSDSEEYAGEKPAEEFVEPAEGPDGQNPPVEEQEPGEPVTEETPVVDEPGEETPVDTVPDETLDDADESTGDETVDEPAETDIPEYEIVSMPKSELYKSVRVGDWAVYTNYIGGVESSREKWTVVARNAATITIYIVYKTGYTITGDDTRTIRLSSTVRIPAIRTDASADTETVKIGSKEYQVVTILKRAGEKVLATDFSRKAPFNGTLRVRVGTEVLRQLTDSGREKN